MSEIKKYAIGGRSFEQRRLVFGQTLQIKQVFAGLFAAIRAAENPGNLTGVLGDQVPKFAAIVLREKGQPLKDKDIAELEDFLLEELDATTAAKVVADFLALTPIASDLTALTQLAGAIGETVVTALKSLSATLPEETSPSESISSGTTDPTTSESGVKPKTEKSSSEKL